MGKSLFGITVLDEVPLTEQDKANIAAMDLRREYHQSRTNFKDFIKNACSAISEGGVIDKDEMSNVLDQIVKERAAYLEAGAKDADDIDAPVFAGSGDKEAYWTDAAKRSLNRDLTQALTEYATENSIPMQFDDKTGLNSINMDNLIAFWEKGDMTSFVNCNPNPPESEPQQQNSTPAADNKETKHELQSSFSSITQSPVVKAVFDQIKKVGAWVKSLGNKVMDKINDLSKRVAQAKNVAPEDNSTNTDTLEIPNG